MAPSILFIRNNKNFGTLHVPELYSGTAQSLQLQVSAIHVLVEYVV